MVNVLLQGPNSECEYGSMTMDFGKAADYLNLLKSVAGVWVKGETVQYSDNALEIKPDGTLCLNIWTKTL